MLTPAHQVLKDVFGYSAFRAQQADIVAHVLQGHDALVLMPTGGGKSLCYQVPAIVRHRAGHGVALVVSPLIALMHDQVGALTEVGVSAAFLNGSLDATTRQHVEQRLLCGELVMLYVTPERLKNPFFISQLHVLYQKGQLNLFAIDEAHCVSQWGHDFREDYLTLHMLHQHFPTVPRIALTATADVFTQKEMVNRLDMHTAKWFMGGFDRPNIHYRIVEKQKPFEQLLRFIKAEHASHAGIVYCQSRKKVEDTAERLNASGLRALPYHAGLSAEMRQRHQDRFLRDEDGLVMVATIAFGMGIDKPDVRFVAHLDLPKNIESYYQETGRAGRDGLPAEAWMTYGLADVINQRRMINESPANDEFKHIQLGKLDALLAMSETHECRRVHLLNYFSEASQPCGNCDNCDQPPLTFNATKAAQQLLSCIFWFQQKSGQAFGATHLIDVLRGKLTDKVKQYDHQTLSTFNIGTDHSEAEWRALLRQLLSLGFVKTDGEYNTLAFTPKTRSLLQGTTQLVMKQLLKQPVKPSSTADADPTRGKPSARIKPVVKALDEAGKARFAMLKAWRQEVAKANNLPAFIIFHDATLMAIAYENPQTLEALAAISGLGQQKMTAYGSAIIQLLQPLPV
jgi:ATP-dependent DNA helicase RecQ